MGFHTIQTPPRRNHPQHHLINPLPIVHILRTNILTDNLPNIHLPSTRFQQPLWIHNLPPISFISTSAIIANHPLCSPSYFPHEISGERDSKQATTTSTTVSSLNRGPRATTAPPTRIVHSQSPKPTNQTPSLSIETSWRSFVAARVFDFPPPFWLLPEKQLSYQFTAEKGVRGLCSTIDSIHLCTCGFKQKENKLRTANNNWKIY